jgi:hypothetical protein
MPKPKSKSNKDSSQSQPETPSVPEQQLLSIKPKRPQPDPLVEAENNNPQPTEQKLLSIKPKKTEEVIPPSEAREQSPLSEAKGVTAPSERTEKPESNQVVIPPSERTEKPGSNQGVTAPSIPGEPKAIGDQEDKPKPTFQKPQLRKAQPPPYKNLEQVTTSNGETFLVGEQVKVTTANYGEYVVAIKFIYEAQDGSIWASYSHTNKEQRHPWRWGCCRADLLKKEINE